MDISSRFSLVDFFAYLFPGFVGTLAVYTLLLLTPLREILQRLPSDLATGVFFLIVSFILGIVFSGFSEILIKYWQPTMREQVKSSIPLTNFENDIVSAFRVVMKSDRESEVTWSRDHFYICRSLVYEKMQNCAEMIQRQSGLRQLRMNLTLPILIWLLAGLFWGINRINNSQYVWGVIVIAVSLSFAPLAFIVIVNRMETNLRREIREVLSAFLAGYRMGMFDKANRDK